MRASAYWWRLHAIVWTARHNGRLWWTRRGCRALRRGCRALRRDSSAWWASLTDEQRTELADALWDQIERGHPGPS